MISLLFAGASSLQLLRKIVVTRSELPEDQLRLLSKDDRWLEFGNYSNRERVPFIVYADLECVLQNPIRKTRRISGMKCLT